MKSLDHITNRLDSLLLGILSIYCTIGFFFLEFTDMQKIMCLIVIVGNLLLQAINYWGRVITRGKE